MSSAPVSGGEDRCVCLSGREDLHSYGPSRVKHEKEKNCCLNFKS